MPSSFHNYYHPRIRSVAVQFCSMIWSGVYNTRATFFIGATIRFSYTHICHLKIDFKQDRIISRVTSPCESVFVRDQLPWLIAFYCGLLPSTMVNHSGGMKIQTLIHLNQSWDMITTNWALDMMDDMGSWDHRNNLGHYHGWPTSKQYCHQLTPNNFWQGIWW